MILSIEGSGNCRFDYYWASDPSQAGLSPAETHTHSRRTDGSGFGEIDNEQTTQTSKTGPVPLARFDSDFNAAASPFPGESFTPEQVAVQPGGRIVVAGYVVSDSGTDLGVARYNADGTLDATFGTGGGATAGLNVATQDPCALALGSDGSIVLAGTIDTPQTGGNDQYSFGVVRFTSDGTLDTTFNGSGEATDGWGDQMNYATSVAIGSDGGIVVAGYDESANGDSG